MKFFLIPFMALFLSLSSSAQEYKRLHRTYLDLTQINLEACKRTYRFLNDNYMDCKVDLPQGRFDEKLSKITPGQYMPQNVSIMAEDGGALVYVDVRDSAYDSIDASLATHLVLSMYYQEPDKPGHLQTLPPDKYDWSVFERYLLQALEKISQERSWKTSSPMIAIPWNSPSVQEHIIGSVYVAKNTIPVDINACQRSLSSELVDAWPDEDYWVTSCSLSVRPLGHAEPLPLNVHYWGPGLKDADAKPIVKGSVAFTYSAWGWHVRIEGKHEWSEIESQVRDTFAQIGTKVDGYYIVDEASLYQYGGPGWTLGKLVQKNGKIDVEPNSPILFRK